MSDQFAFTVSKSILLHNNTLIILKISSHLQYIYFLPKGNFSEEFYSNYKYKCLKNEVQFRTQEYDFFFRDSLYHTGTFYVPLPVIKNKYVDFLLLQ